MPNMLDYITWRGDLQFSQAPFSPVDGLILAQFSYVALDGVVTGPTTVGEAARTMLWANATGKIAHQTEYLWKENLQLLEALKDCPRFQDVKLVDYENVVSPAEVKQFAAETFQLEDGSLAVAIRGTDDSLIGWKEDMNMAFESPIPAQLDSVRYLKNAAAQYEGPIRVCGHSKGGNLAVYAGAMCGPEVQDRIDTIYNFDGPGMDEKTIQDPGYGAVRKKMEIYFPHFALVGMLLEHEDTYQLVKSDARAVMQHDAFSWQVTGPAFIKAEQANPVSLRTNKILKTWLASLSFEERRQFTDAVYEIVTSGGDQTLADLEANWQETAKKVISGIYSLNGKKRETFHKCIGDLFSTAISTLRLSWIDKLKEKTAE